MTKGAHQGVKGGDMSPIGANLGGLVTAPNIALTPPKI